MLNPHEHIAGREHGRQIQGQVQTLLIIDILGVGRDILLPSPVCGADALDVGDDIANCPPRGERLAVVLVADGLGGNFGVRVWRVVVCRQPPDLQQIGHARGGGGVGGGDGDLLFDVVIDLNFIIGAVGRRNGDAAALQRGEHEGKRQPEQSGHGKQDER